MWIQLQDHFWSVAKKVIFTFECGTWKSNFKWTLLFSCCCWLLTSNWDRHASPVKRSMACHDNSNKYVRTKETCEITHPIPIQLYFAKKRRKPRRGGGLLFVHATLNFAQVLISYKKWLTWFMLIVPLLGSRAFSIWKMCRASNLKHLLELDRPTLKDFVEFWSSNGDRGWPR